MVLCRVFSMFGTMFVACFVASIGRILWLVDKGCSGMVSGQNLACTGAAKELSGTPVRGSHAIAWMGSNLQPSGTQLHGFPRNCVAPASSGTLLRSPCPCTMSNLQLLKAITPSSELRFGCSWTLWKAL